MPTGQTMLFNFLRLILVGVLAAILLFGSQILLANLGVDSTNILSYLINVVALLILTIVNSLLLRWTSKEDYPYFQRQLGQQVICYFFIVIVFLPLFLIFGPKVGALSTLTLMYTVTILFASDIWNLVYNKNEVKNILVYGLIFSPFAALAATLLLNGTGSPTLPLIAVIAWYVGSFAITAILSVFYLGLNQFYNAQFWHFLPLVKTDSAKKPAPEANPEPAANDQE